jgi:hypothetical protein
MSSKVFSYRCFWNSVETILLLLNHGSDIKQQGRGKFFCDHLDRPSEFYLRSSQSGPSIRILSQIFTIWTVHQNFISDLHNLQATVKMSLLSCIALLSCQCFLIIIYHSSCCLLCRLLGVFVCVCLFLSPVLSTRKAQITIVWPPL